MTPKHGKPTAGRRLLDSYTDALQRHAAEVGYPLAFTEQEQAALAAAAEAADRADQLRALYADELARKPEPRASTLVRYSSELRALDKSVVDLTARVQFEDGPSVSARHQYAANKRWANTPRSRAKRG